MSITTVNGVTRHQTNGQSYAGAKYMPIRPTPPDVRIFPFALEPSEQASACHFLAARAHAEMMAGVEPEARIARTKGGRVIFIRSTSAGRVRVDGIPVAQWVCYGRGFGGVVLRSARILGAGVVPAEGRLISLGVDRHYVVAAQRLEPISRRVYLALLRQMRPQARE